jgi:hypothetical protein
MTSSLEEMLSTQEKEVLATLLGNKPDLGTAICCAIRRADDEGRACRKTYLADRATLPSGRVAYHAYGLLCDCLSPDTWRSQQDAGDVNLVARCLLARLLPGDKAHVLRGRFHGLCRVSARQALEALFDDLHKNG